MSSYECLYNKLKNALSTESKNIMCDTADIANVLEELKEYREIADKFKKLVDNSPFLRAFIDMAEIKLKEQDKE